tara:strand:+ start:9380 stop:10135 length:756 start_codon:yes stop_codon:yes gene_type:complete
MVNIHKGLILSISLCFVCCNNSNLESIKFTRIEINGQKDTIISEQIRVYKDSMSKLASNIDFDKIIGYSEGLFTMNDYDKKYFNTSLGNLIADALFIQSDSLFEKKESKNIDFVLQNHGGVRSSLLVGDIKIEDIFKILPFENEIVVLELSGEIIFEIVKFLTNEKNPHPISGIIINKDEVLINDKLIDNSKIYYVATNDYLLEGGDNMFFLKKNNKVYRLNYSLRSAFIDFVESNFKIKSKVDNRFIKNE